ncbi:MAG: acyl-CoA synthetase (NDP forming) [Arenicella sp.]|jgi:acyl-CoA synthetase (NDP forming)
MPCLKRFLNPKSIAVFGGAWAVNVIEQLIKSNYQGNIWPVHPHRDNICGLPAYRNIDDLPGSPDAAFIGVNREATIDVVAELKARAAGGAICFASGFKESQINAEVATHDLQARLIEVAGNMPILGPNCYGYLNYLDNVCLWPDQHAGKPVSEGVAIIAQSSNIAINMTMQRRGLALTHMLTVGNQAQIGVSELAMAVLSDPRVKAVGLHLEGFGDIRAFEKMANHARALGKPLVALKIGKSAKAQLASLTHTASLAGNAVVSSAFLARLGIAEVDSISALLETLKILHQIGPLSSPAIASMSCSGGEASLMSDLALNSALVYPDLSSDQRSKLTAILGDKVDLANPLDYHTYVWGDVPAMTACFSAVLSGGCALNVLVLDLPRSDYCEPQGHYCAIEAIIAAKQNTGANVAVLSVLPENLEEAINQRLIEAEIVPLHGMSDGIAAIDAAIRSGELLTAITDYQPVALAPVAQEYISQAKALESGDGSDAARYCLDEAAAKQALHAFGLLSPASQTVVKKSDVIDAAKLLNFPLVLKGLGVAHKTEANAVVLGIQTKAELAQALESITDCADGYLIEEMVSDVIAELLVGITVDKTGLMLLTIGAGGIFTELMSDSVSLCLPTSAMQIADTIERLKIAKLLHGYRGKPGVNFTALVDAIDAIVQFSLSQRDSLIELDINPLMVGQQKSVAADALIRLSK